MLPEELCCSQSPSGSTLPALEYFRKRASGSTLPALECFRMYIYIQYRRPHASTREASSDAPRVVLCRMLGGAQALQARAPDAQRNHGVHVHLLARCHLCPVSGCPGMVSARHTHAHIVGRWFVVLNRVQTPTLESFSVVFEPGSQSSLHCGSARLQISTVRVPNAVAP